MTDYNPNPAAPDPGVPVAAVEDDPSKPIKAYAATALTAVGTFVAFWVADTDPFTAKEAGQGALLALAASGLTGGATFQVSNPKRVKKSKKVKKRR